MTVYPFTKNNDFWIFLNLHWSIIKLEIRLLVSAHYNIQLDKYPQRDILKMHKQRMREEQDQLEDQNEEEVESIKNPKWNAYKAVAMLLLGTVVAAVFADPLVDAVDNFSTATSIPSFFVSFVVLPFASSSEVVSAMIFASRKKIRTASLTLSEVCFSSLLNLYMA